MKAIVFAVLAAAGLFAIVDPALAGGKPDGASCHVSKSCRSKYCVTLNPTDKFGVCCSPQDCPAQNAQCGQVDNGCGVPIQCGSCDPGSSCVSNQCVVNPSTTTTSTTTTTTSTTSTTTTTTSSTTSTTVAPTTTTLAPTTTTSTSTTSTTGEPPQPRTCVGFCGNDGTPAPGDGPECYCDFFSCGFGDGCADRDTACPDVCTPRSCAGYCNQDDVVPPGNGPECYCDTTSCSADDGCADRDTQCPDLCAP